MGNIDFEYHYTTSDEVYDAIYQTDEAYNIFAYMLLNSVDTVTVEYGIPKMYEDGSDYVLETKGILYINLDDIAEECDIVELTRQFIKDKRCKSKE